MKRREVLESIARKLEGRPKCQTHSQEAGLSLNQGTGDMCSARFQTSCG